MRDLTKSVIGVSWAMSMLGVQQLVNVFNRSGVADPLNHLTDAAKKELVGITEATFSAGDNLQKGMIDAAFGLLGPRSFDTNSWAKMTSSLFEQTVGVLGRVIGGVTGAAQPPPAGWGPVPPANGDIS